MNIQPNYAYKNYSTPAFKAELANDDKTKNAIHYAMDIPMTYKDCKQGEYDAPEYIHCLSENLKRIKSNNVISIELDTHADYQVPGVYNPYYGIYDYYVKNTNTGDSITIRETRNKRDGSYSYGILVGIKREEKLSSKDRAQALYDAITSEESLEKLFGTDGAKKKSEFLTPQNNLFESKVEGMSDVAEEIDQFDQKVNGINEEIAEHQRQIAQLEEQIKELNKEQYPLVSRYNYMKAKYVLDEFGLPM